MPHPPSTHAWQTLHNAIMTSHRSSDNNHPRMAAPNSGINTVHVNSMPTTTVASSSQRELVTSTPIVRSHERPFNNPSSWSRYDTYTLGMQRVNPNRLLITLASTDKLIDMLKAPVCVVLVASFSFPMHPLNLKYHDAKHTVLDVCSPNPFVIAPEQRCLPVSVYVPENAAEGALSTPTPIITNVTSGSRLVNQNQGLKRKFVSSSRLHKVPAMQPTKPNPQSMCDLQQAKNTLQMGNRPHQHHHQQQQPQPQQRTLPVLQSARVSNAMNIDHVMQTHPNSSGICSTTYATPTAQSSVAVASSNASVIDPMMQFLFPGAVNLLSGATVTTPSSVSTTPTAATYQQLAMAAAEAVQRQSSLSSFLTTLANYSHCHPTTSSGASMASQHTCRGAEPIPANSRQSLSVTNNADNANLVTETVTLLDMAKAFLQETQCESKTVTEDNPICANSTIIDLCDLSDDESTGAPSPSKSISPVKHSTKSEPMAQYPGCSSTCSPISTNLYVSPTVAHLSPGCKSTNIPGRNTVQFFQNVENVFDIMDRILYYLPLSDRLRCRRVSRGWRRLVDSSNAWRSIQLRQSTIQSWMSACEKIKHYQNCDSLEVIVDNDSAINEEFSFSHLCKLTSSLATCLTHLTIIIASHSVNFKVIWLDELLKPLIHLKSFSITSNNSVNAQQIRLLTSASHSLISNSLQKMNISGQVNPDFLCILHEHNLPHFTCLRLEVSNGVYLDNMKSLKPSIPTLRHLHLHLNLPPIIRNCNGFQWLSHMKHLKSLTITGISASSPCLQIFKEISSLPIDILTVKQNLSAETSAPMQIIQLLPVTLNYLHWYISVSKRHLEDLRKSDPTMHFMEEQWFASQINSYYKDNYQKNIQSLIKIILVEDSTAN